MDDTRCVPCGICTGGCPSRVFKDLLPESATLRGQLGETAQAGQPLCQEACPLGQDIKGYVGSIAHGNQEEALEIILRDNPMPSVLGYVCHHPCEGACHLNSLTRSPRLRELKAYAARAPRPPAGPHRGPSRPRVAIIGSGPAGLAAAWHLAREGASVTVYEAERVAGGLLGWAIPSFRLPSGALQTDLNYILSFGISLKLGHRVTPEEVGSLLSHEDAVILACGAPLSFRPGIPGLELSGVCLGLDFLRQAALGPEPILDEPIAVVGGGNAAMDVARWVLRRTKGVTLFYRRDQEDMPAYGEEISAARNEGLTMVYRVEPQCLLSDERGRCRGIRLQKTLPGEMGPDGRRLFLPDPRRGHGGPCPDSDPGLGAGTGG